MTVVLVIWLIVLSVLLYVVYRRAEEGRALVATGGRMGPMGGANSAYYREQLARSLNKAIGGGSALYEESAVADVALSAEAESLLERGANGAALVRLNRLLLADAFPRHFPRPPTAGRQILLDVGVIPIAALAYSALFVLLATVVAKPLIFGLLFAFGWESWVPNMGGNFQKLSVMTYVRVLAPHPKPGTQGGDLTEIFRAINPETLTTPQAAITLALVIVVGLAGACFLFSTREFVPRAAAA